MLWQRLSTNCYKLSTKTYQSISLTCMSTRQAWFEKFLVASQFVVKFCHNIKTGWFYTRRMVYQLSFNMRLFVAAAVIFRLIVTI